MKERAAWIATALITWGITHAIGALIRSWN